MVLWIQNGDFRTWLTSLYGSQTSSVVLSIHNSVISTRIKRRYLFQSSPVDLCMQNSDFRTRITSLCGSKTPPVFFASKTSTSGPYKLVSLVLKSPFCMHTATDEGWNPYRLVILEKITLFCILKTSGEGWNQYRLFILVLSTLLCLLKTTD